MDGAAFQPGFDLGESHAPTPRKRKPKTSKTNLSTPPTIATAASLAASLPPRRASTREEIEARRAERRDRIAKDKAEGRRDNRGRPVKHRSADVIVRLASRLDDDGRVRGVTMAELSAALGWKPSTVRSYIGGVLRKRGIDLRVTLTKGEARRYVIPPTDKRKAKFRTFALRGAVASS